MLTAPIRGAAVYIKIISTSDWYGVEDLVNEWLRKEGRNNLIQDMQVSKGERPCVMIIYTR